MRNNHRWHAPESNGKRQNRVADDRNHSHPPDGYSRENTRFTNRNMNGDMNGDRREEYRFNNRYQSRRENFDHKRRLTYHHHQDHRHDPRQAHRQEQYQRQDDDHPPDQLVAIHINFQGKLSVAQEPSACVDESCSLFVCDATEGNMYYVNACFLLPTSDSSKILDFIKKKIFCKGDDSLFYKYLPKTNSAMYTYRTIPVKKEDILSNRFELMIGSASHNDVDDEETPTFGKSFIVDMTNQNYFSEYNHGFDELYEEE